MGFCIYGDGDEIDRKRIESVFDPVFFRIVREKRIKGMQYVGSFLFVVHGRGKEANNFMA